MCLCPLSLYTFMQYYMCVLFTYRMFPVDPPGPSYYRDLRDRLGPALTEEQYTAIEVRA